MRNFFPVRSRLRPQLLELDARIVPSFTPLTPFTNGLVSPAAAASADFNRDGLEDLAVFNRNGGTADAPFIAVLLSSGDGQFIQSDALDAERFSSPTSLITADFNGDGIADLASGSESENARTLRVYLGNGDGTFAQSFIDPVDTSGLGAGDFNGDGRTDLVALQNGGSQYRIYLGNGTGQFAALPPVIADSFDSRILTGDLDINGTDDFLSIDFRGVIAAYLGNGDGTFAPVVLTTTAGSVNDFAIGQFDADGLLDVVTIEGFNLVLHSNLGGGRFNAAGVAFFTLATSGVRLASTDFNSDGRPDLVANDAFGQASVLTSNGNGTFTPDGRNPYAYGGFGSQLITGDFDGDRHPDFAVLADNLGHVFLNDLPDSTITTLVASPVRTFVGRPVTFAATVAPAFPGHDTPQGTVTFISGSTVLGTATLVNGVATFTTSTLPAGSFSVIATYPGSPAVRDINGDVLPRRAALLASQSGPVGVIVKNFETPEFAAGSDNGSVICLHNLHTDTLKGFDSFGGPFTGVRPALGDYNGDGVSDIAVGSSPGTVAQVSVVDGATRQLLFAVQPFDGFLGGVFVASGDFNGDGIADLAVGADAGDRPHVKVFLTLDGALVQVASFYAFDEGFRGGVRVAAGDINGDGFADLVVGAGAGAGPSVAVFDGTGLIGGVARRFAEDYIAYDPGFRGGVFVAVGDVDGDGSADIITGAGLGAPHVTVVSGLSLLQQNPTQLASFFAADPANLGGIRVAARDLNRDGFSDVIAGAGFGNGSTAWTFSGATLARDGTAVATSAEDVFPGLFAGIYVG